MATFKVQHKYFEGAPASPHYEAETYAWGVLPEALQQPDLATGIARELVWLRDQIISR